MRIECVTVAGIGAPLHWRVGVGVVPQSDNPTLYSEPMKEVDSGYQPPSIAGVSAPLLDTAGGESITLSGSNFGPGSLGNISATYGGHDSTSTRRPGAPSRPITRRPSAEREVPGIGANLSWSIHVGGQRSDDAEQRHCFVQAARDRAQVQGAGANALSGAGAVDADTRGGEALVVTGYQLGPIGDASAPVLVYGVDGQYRAANCEVTTAHATVTCETAAGVGRNHPIALWVGRQWSNTYDANMSYSGPVVAGYDGVARRPHGRKPAR